MRKLIVSLVAASVLATGCASLGNQTETLVVQYAVLKVTEDKPATAAKVIEIANDAKTFFDVEFVSVANVKAAILKRISKLDLDAADTLLANALVDAVAADLEGKVGAGLISPEAKIRVNKVLDAVITAASLSL